ncbi:MAG: Ig-like domain-containing protein [Leptospiraceae bacterium]|nr:Ig-like domain-containing protein [Leptospiraceae bacterium]
MNQHQHYFIYKFFIIKMTILLFFFLSFLSCNKKGTTIAIPMLTNNSAVSPVAKTYISDNTITPPVFDYSNETTLPVDFGISVSAAMDAPNLSYVDRYKPIGILFSTMMDRSSVQNHFELKDASNQTIDGTFYWSGSKLYFKPYHPLDPKTTYTVRITQDAKNFDGINLENDFIQSFTTEPAFLMTHTLKLGSLTYDVSPSTANNGVIIDTNAYNGSVIVESTLTGADHVTRMRLFRLGLGEDKAYTVCDSNSPCNNNTVDTGKFTLYLTSLNPELQPIDGANIYYYYIETTSGRTYVRPFAFQRGKPSSDPNELQPNGGWLALENNSTKGMYQIKRLFERFIKSDGSHTGDNFTIDGKTFNDYLNNPKAWGPINNSGCLVPEDSAYSGWTTTYGINYVTNFGPYCNMKVDTVLGNGKTDIYVSSLIIPPLVNNNTNINVEMLPDSSKLKIILKGKKLNGVMRSYIRNMGGLASIANGFIYDIPFYMNESTQKDASANTNLTINNNGDMVITIQGGPNWPINDTNFNVQQWVNAIQTGSLQLVKGDSGIFHGIINVLVTAVTNTVVPDLKPLIVQGTIKDTIEKVSANIMNAVLSKTRVDGVNDGINICLPGYLPDPLKTICLTTGAKMKPSSSHIGWEVAGLKGIRSFLEANMTVVNSNTSWPRPPALVGPGNKGFIKFIPSFTPDNNLVNLFNQGYQGALVVLNADVVNQAAYGLWKEGAFNFKVDKPTLESINNVAGSSNLTALADKLLKADAILTVIAPGQSNFVVRDQSNNEINIEKNDPVKIETVLLYPPDLNPLYYWKSTGNPKEQVQNRASFTGFRMKLIGGKDSNNDGVPDYNFYTLATVVVNLTTKATIEFIPYSNPNNYIPACNDGHCRALSINVSTADEDMRYTIEVLEDPVNNPLGLDPRAVYDVFNPLIKSFVAPLVANVLKEIPFDADMSACGIKIEEVTVEPISTSYTYPFGLLNVRLAETPFSGDCNF